MPHVTDRLTRTAQVLLVRGGRIGWRVAVVTLTRWRRQAALTLALGLALVACSQPAPAPATPAPVTPTPPASTRPPTVAPTLVPTAPPTAAPSPTSPFPQTFLDIRVWNGSAEIQVDGRTVEPGHLIVPIAEHHIVALVNGQVVDQAITPPSPEGRQVDLVVPPPLSPLAIVVENQEDARPQSGLPSADVVYETLAEGGITRFLAVFLTGDAAPVGPVRSLRHYFAFLAGDYGADLVHIGASPEGFAWRDAMNLGKLDESARDPGMFRVRSRPAPHNAYTSTEQDRQILAARGRQRGGSWGPLRFSAPDAPPGGGQPADTLTVSFPPWPYRARYDWDPSSGHYLRFMNNVPHNDAETGEQIAPASIVVQFASIEPIPRDDKLRVDIDLVGSSGPLLVFSGGSQREGTWSKAAPREPTRWFDGQGQPVVLPPGRVWVEIVPQTAAVQASANSPR